MAAEQAAFEPPHPTIEAPARGPLPARPLLVRGVGLAGLAVALLAAATRTITAAGWIALPVAGVLAAGAVLSAWAATIQLTGGELFDDHHWDE